VQTNRRRLADLAGLPWERIARGRQVHGITVHLVDDGSPASIAEHVRRPGDGQATALRDVGGLVLVADCLPIALGGPGAVAMLHVGWRGLADGILARGLGRLRELTEVSDPIVAAIGPGIGGCCYEVGDEVRAAFGALAPEASQARRLDLKLIARRQFDELGVTRVHDVALCTACSDPSLFFSHRRDGGVTGRQCGIVWRS
jgi:YfiH family protein